MVHFSPFCFSRIFVILILLAAVGCKKTDLSQGKKPAKVETAAPVVQSPPPPPPKPWFYQAVQGGHFIWHNGARVCFFVVENETQSQESKRFGKDFRSGGYGYGYATRSLAISQVEARLCPDNPNLVIGH
jgi:hypothetical protein